jgi:hypothetical protein
VHPHCSNEPTTAFSASTAFTNPSANILHQVLRECQIIAPHEEEVLQSVAAVMTRPGRNSPAAQRARGAARDLLRSYGRSGYDAIRQAARTNYAAARQGAGTPPMYIVGTAGAPTGNAPAGKFIQ